MTIVRDTLRGLLTEPNRSLWREGGREGGEGRESTFNIAYTE